MADNSGKIVTVSYVGKLDSGWQFISTPPDAPISFPCAPGWMPPEFIDTVRTMEVGETRVAHVSAEAAYEKPSEDNIVRVAKGNLPADANLEVGDIVHLQDPNGKEFPARLVGIEGAEAIFDANHQSVGQGMHFEITLLSVRDTPARRQKS